MHDRFVLAGAVLIMEPRGGGGRIFHLNCSVDKEFVSSDTSIQIPPNSVRGEDRGLVSGKLTVPVLYQVNPKQTHARAHMHPLFLLKQSGPVEAV